ncbi:MAG: acylphosphatase [Methylococcales bacterium]|nr:acylphosphatase [Methylococcales bacterium]
MIKTIQIIVSGRVQGVCFRANTQKIALIHQIDGWVKNCPDGRVEIRARADSQQLDQLIAWCHKGPLFAKVDSVTVSDMPIESPEPAVGFIITQ